MWELLLGGALVGGALGWLNTKRERDREKNALDRRMSDNAAAYGYGRELGDSQYSLQKGEALWQLGMRDRSLREGMNRFADEYNTYLLARAYGEQDARIQTASGVGASLVQEGMGGTRGNEALQLMRDYAANSTERRIDLQRRQDANTLAGAISDTNLSVTEMAHERASWDPGGYRYESKAAQDDYNKRMFELGQANYQWQLDDINDPANTFLDYTLGIFGGASSGMSLGGSIARFNSDWGYDFDWNSMLRKGFKNG